MNISVDEGVTAKTLGFTGEIAFKTRLFNFLEAIQLPDGSLLGTAAFGGLYKGGVVYQISASGVYSIVHHFGSVPSDGNLPFCVLNKAPDGTIYRTTWIGGTNGAGVIFKLIP